MKSVVVSPARNSGLRSTATRKSRFVVMHTDQDGATKLFATGLYQDQVTVKDQCTRLQNRTVYLDTRDLGPGIHVPI